MRHSDLADFVVPLDVAQEENRTDLGGKAANLARLIRGGLPVPEGFCVSAAAFDCFVASCSSREELARLLRGTVEATPSACLARSVSILKLLRGVAVPEPVAAAVQDCWRRFGQGGAYAVRSSASVEDGAKCSFAGQFTSSLNVYGLEPLLESIKDCWSSLFSPRALAYHARQGLLPGDTRVAVVVQKMVPADRSGVIFTMDPVSGDDSRVIIEVGRGLGESVVSGHVVPEEIIVEKASGRVLGTRSSEREPLLDSIQISLLTKCALKAEGLYGHALDLEWAIARNEAFLLQARPVTARGGAPSRRQCEIWLNMNTGEIFPDVATPMTWCMVQHFADALFSSIARLLGADMHRAPWLGLVAGRIYFSANTGSAALRPFPLIRRFIPEVIQTIGGGSRKELEQIVENLATGDLPDLGFRWWKYLASWPRLAWSLVKHRPSRGGRWLDGLKEESRKLAAMHFDQLPTPALARKFAQLIREGFGRWDLLYLAAQGAPLLVFREICRRWFDDSDLSRAARLFSGLGGIPETEAGLALWRLAEFLNREAVLKQVVAHDQEWATLRIDLEKTIRGTAFLAAWDEFMAEHGHRCRGELELSNERWSEQPDYILRLIRGFAQPGNQADPIARHRELQQERERLTQVCRQQLANPLKRLVFTWSLRKAQELTVTREEWKNAAVRQIGVLRRMLLVLGARLADDGVLARAGDIFFLDVDELETAASGADGARVRDRIMGRRAEYEANAALHPPPLVRGHFQGTQAPEPSTAGSSRVLEGIPIYPGVVTGRARVILRADDQQQVQPGEILVAPFTDPAWTPYFLPAAAVAVDQGGILSHGSIVAREYGLPAVTNLGTATRRIRTGDLVQVDGTRGTVTILGPSH